MRGQHERSVARPAVGGERAAGDGDVDALGVRAHGRTVLPAPVRTRSGRGRPVKRAGAADDHPSMRPAPRPRAARRARARRLRRAGAPGGRGRQRPPAPSPPAARDAGGRPGPRERPPSLAIGYLRRDTLRKQAFERWRLAELAKARRSRTVAGALRRALLARHIAPGRARPPARHLRAARATAPAGCPACAARSCGRWSAPSTRWPRARRLTAGRFAPVFLTLRRNDEFWRTRAAAGARARASCSAATPRCSSTTRAAGCSSSSSRAGAASTPASARACRGGGRCPRAQLGAQLDRLVALGARRDSLRRVGVLLLLRRRHAAVDQRHDAGHGGPGARARLRACCRPRRYRRTAVRALGAFRAPPPVGVARRRAGRQPLPHVLLLARPADPQRRPAGDHRAARPGDARRAAAPRACSTAAASAPRARAVGGFDTGAWSLYSESGRESTLGYHQLVGQLPRQPLPPHAAGAPTARPSGASPATSASRRGSTSRGLARLRARARHRAALLAVQARLRARARHGRLAA